MLKLRIEHSRGLYNAFNYLLLVIFSFVYVQCITNSTYHPDF